MLNEWRRLHNTRALYHQMLKHIPGSHQAVQELAVNNEAVCKDAMKAGQQHQAKWEVMHARIAQMVAALRVKVTACTLNKDKSAAQLTANAETLSKHAKSTPARV